MTGNPVIKMFLEVFMVWQQAGIFGDTFMRCCGIWRGTCQPLRFYSVAADLKFRLHTKPSGAILTPIIHLLVTTSNWHFGVASWYSCRNSRLALRKAVDQSDLWLTTCHLSVNLVCNWHCGISSIMDKFLAWYGDKCLLAGSVIVNTETRPQNKNHISVTVI